MKENTVVAFQNPSDFQKDPLTEVLQAGARELLAQAVEAEVSVFLGSHAALVDAAGRRRVVRCQRRSKSTPLAGVKMYHLMRFSPALAVVPVVHRRDPRCFV